VSRIPHHPVLDVRGPAEAQTPLSLSDAVAAVVSDFSPFAIEERGPSAVRVYFASASDRNAARVAVTTTCGPSAKTSATSIADEDWAARSQADLRSIRVGRVVVAPPWDLPAPQPDDTEVVVVIRPALGFGSGHHPTTRLALLGLQQLDLDACDVLDLGTGSGILAIAAVKLGARRAMGIDRDPDALASARESVTANHVSPRVDLREGSVSQLPSTVGVVVANLTGTVLTGLAPVIMTLVDAGGHLVLSGIPTEEEAAVAGVYRRGARLVWRAVEDEWVGMVWRRGQRTQTTSSASTLHGQAPPTTSSVTAAACRPIVDSGTKMPRPRYNRPVSRSSMPRGSAPQGRPRCRATDVEYG